LNASSDKQSSMIHSINPNNTAYEYVNTSKLNILIPIHDLMRSHTPISPNNILPFSCPDRKASNQSWVSHPVTPAAAARVQSATKVNFGLLLATMLSGRLYCCVFSRRGKYTTISFN